MNKLIKIGLVSLMMFTIGCSSKKNDYQSEPKETTSQTENSSKKDGIQNDGEGIGTIYIPIDYCPYCGRKLGKDIKYDKKLLWKRG